MVCHEKIVPDTQEEFNKYSVLLHFLFSRTEKTRSRERLNLENPKLRSLRSVSEVYFPKL